MDLHSGKGTSDLDETCRTGSIVIGAVIDVVALIGGADAEMVEMSGVDEVFVFQFGIGAGQNSDDIGAGAVFMLSQQMNLRRDGQLEALHLAFVGILI